MSKRQSNQCYICGNETTSKEHAPADCFFPDDPALKKNLITVRSCTLHNEATSKDDKYVRNIIAMCIGNNAVAFNQFITKTVKSFEESPGLFKITTQNAQRVHTIEGSLVKKSLALNIDRNRVDKVLKKIAYAVFYHTYITQWNRKLIIQSEFFRTDDMQMDDLGKLIAMIKPMLGDFELIGNNPQVFKYRFLPSTSNEIHDQVLVMKFYEGFEVWITIVEGSAGSAI